MNEITNFILNETELKINDEQAHIKIENINKTIDNINKLINSLSEGINILNEEVTSANNSISGINGTIDRLKNVAFSDDYNDLINQPIARTTNGNFNKIRIGDRYIIYGYTNFTANITSKYGIGYYGGLYSINIPSNIQPPNGFGCSMISVGSSGAIVNANYDGVSKSALKYFLSSISSISVAVQVSFLLIGY